MRVSAAFSRLLDLEGIWVWQVQFFSDRVVVRIALRRRRLRCPLCEFSTPHRYNQQAVESVWRHLDLGIWRLELRAQLRRLKCPQHGVRVEGVPFARHRSGFTCDFEALVAWLATRTDQTTITRLVRIDWDTVGGIIARVSADQLDRDRLENLFEIGIEGEAGLETVDHVPTGGRVTIACRGRGCPFSRKTFRRARSVTLTRYFAGAHLLPGATVDVRITAPNSVGKDALLTTRSGAGPTEVDLCLPPGARKPLKCAS